jgi:hypothetical protein
VAVKNSSFFLKEASSRSYASNMEDEVEGNRWEELEQTMVDSLSRDRRESCGSCSSSGSKDEHEGVPLLPETIKSLSDISTHSSLSVDFGASSSHSLASSNKSTPRSARNNIFAGQLEQQRASLTQEDLQQVRNVIEESFGYEDNYSGDSGHEGYRYSAQNECLREQLPQGNIKPSPRNGRGKLSRQHTGTTEVSLGDHGEDVSEAAHLTGQRPQRGTGERDCSDALWCFLCF